MDNERRADLGRIAVEAAASITNVGRVEDTQTAITDVLAYVAHLCDRYALVPEAVFMAGLRSYQGDAEDGPPAQSVLDASRPLMSWPIDH